MKIIEKNTFFSDDFSKNHQRYEISEYKAFLRFYRFIDYQKSILYLFIIPLSCYHNKTRIIPAETYLTFLKISTWYYSLILVNDIQKISMAQIIKNITRSNG